MPENIPYIDTTAVSDDIHIFKIENPFSVADSVQALFPALKFYTGKENANHHITGKDGQAHPFTLHTQSWLTLLFVFIFFIYAHSTIRFRKFWVEQIKGLLKIKERMSFFADSSLKDTRQTTYLSIIAIIHVAVLSYIFVATLYPNRAANNLYVLLFFAIIYIFYGFRFVVLRFLGFVFFNNKGVTDHFQNSLFTLISIFGISLYINNLLLIYTSLEAEIIFLILGGILFLFFTLFKSFLILKFFCNNIVSYLYFILYLCTLEILPIIVLFRILVEVNGQNLTNG